MQRKATDKMLLWFYLAFLALFESVIFAFYIYPARVVLKNVVHRKTQTVFFVSVMFSFN